MKFEIKNRFSGDLIFSVETDNWKLAVEAAIKAKADLSYADLSYADLSSANSALPTSLISVTTFGQFSYSQFPKYLRYASHS